MMHFLSRLVGLRSRRPIAVRATPRRLLSVEELEARCVPTATAVTVTLATDPTGTHSGVSLRDAIAQVNAGKASIIAFNIPGSGAHTITVGSPLPTITVPVTIDGTTQPGYGGNPLIALTRSGKSVAGDGLLLTGGNSAVRGLSLYGFASYGLHFQTGGSNLVTADFLGVKPNGAQPGNNGGGLWLDNSSANTVGGTSLALANLIEGNGGPGVYVANSSNDALQGNTINNNSGAGISVYHGTNITIGNTGAGLPTKVLNNGSAGVLIDGGSNALSTAINIANAQITNNGGDGVSILHGTTAVTIQTNIIRYNGGNGVEISASSNISIGGNSLGLGNVVDNNGSKKTGDGIYIHDQSFAITVSDNSSTRNTVNGIEVGNSGATVPAGKTYSITISGNSVPNNGGNGILLDNATGSGASNVLVTGNASNNNSLNGITLTGGATLVTITGNTLANNGLHGIEGDASSSVVIGGTTLAAGNLISDNGFSSPSAQGITLNGATGYTIQGNRITGNALQGIYTLSASNITIGGTATGAGNTIAGNGYDGDTLAAGILLEGTSNVQIIDNYLPSNGNRGIHVATSSGVSITGNTITDNGTSGVLIDSGRVNRPIDGPSNNVTVTGNTIVGNGQWGVRVSDSGSESVFPAGQNFSIIISNNNIQGNGASAGVLIDDNVDNAPAHVLVGQSSNVQVKGNTIDGSNGAGIRVDNAAGNISLDSNILFDNGGNSGVGCSGIYLGRNSNGVTIVNNTITNSGDDGIRADTVTNITIGGTGALGNTIQSNFGNGITLLNVATASLTGNTITGNMQDGVVVNKSSSGVTFPSGNTITNNLQYGVVVLAPGVGLPDTTANSLFGNFWGDLSTT
jgi:parallel beta-helix repeat protein